jgi:DNA mismatch repair protein MutS2
MRELAAKVLRDLRWNDVCDALASRAQTDLGRARCLAWPFPQDEAGVRRSLDLVDEIRGLHGGSWELPVGAARDIGSLLECAKRGGVLEGVELVGSARVLRAAVRTKDFIAEREAECPTLAAIGRDIGDHSALAGRIEGSFDPSGELSDRASPFLAELREKARREQAAIKTKLDVLLHDTGFLRLLQEPYFTIRNERYVLPVASSFRSQVPGIVHGASQTGHTLFVEPDVLIAQGNELAIALSLAREEERRILKELSEDLGASADDAVLSLRCIAELDAQQAAARLAKDAGANRPDIAAPQGSLRLHDLRHPVLALSGRPVVANDVELPEGAAALIISGPNAGGKTVTITAVGLCAAMTRAGLPIPAARGSRIPLYDDVRTAIGDEQDMSKDLSTFTAHLAALREITEAADAGTLVIVDEIAQGTAPREGAAIALAVLEHLVGKDARMFITTHLDELKALGLTDKRFANARVGFDTEKLAPTYRLEIGHAGTSSAVDIARRMGFPPAICDRAQELLTSGVGPLSAALEVVERERTALATARREAEEAKAATQRAAESLEQQRRALETRERELVTEGRRDLLKEIENTRTEIRATIARLQKQPSLAGAAEAQGFLDDFRASQEKALAAPAPKSSTPAAVTRGTRVRLLKLSQEGEVLEVEGQEVLVNVGAIRLRAKLDEVEPIGKKKDAGRFPGKKTRTEALAVAESAAPQEVKTAEATCDVRGLRAEDALREVQSFLDGLYGRGETEAIIVHGLGTGALKAAIREYLSGSPYVKKFRPGASHEGGDGATVVDLR